MFAKFIAAIFWVLTPWKLRTQPPPQNPTILIGAPHTSNWDFVFMLAIAWRFGMKIKWLGKDSLFRGWRGPIMRSLGGIAVDRKNPGGLVRTLIAQAQAGEIFTLVITPDGTRKGHSRWKSGFYRMAQATGMPVMLGYVDRTTKTVGLGETIKVTGDVVADMQKIRAFYADKSGFHPQYRVEPRLIEEDRLGEQKRG